MRRSDTRFEICVRKKYIINDIGTLLNRATAQDDGSPPTAATAVAAIPIIVITGVGLAPVVITLGA